MVELQIQSSDQTNYIIVRLKVDQRAGQHSLTVLTWNLHVTTEAALTVSSVTWVHLRRVAVVRRTLQQDPLSRIAVTDGTSDTLSAQSTSTKPASTENYQCPVSTTEGVVRANDI